MGKKVLLISASPRKGGNSDTLCDQFILGAEEAGNQAEKVFLGDRVINYCTACDTCLENGGNCIQTDDMVEIIDNMIAADVMVMATPVYFYSMNAQMKTVIDRTYPKYTSLRNKDVYLIVTAAVRNKQALERTIGGFRGFTSLFTGVKEKCIVYGTGAWHVGDIEGSKAMTEAYEMGKAV